MGTRREFVCPGCGYRATVSGGDDCGFFVATRTVVCGRCATIADVVSSETPWDPGATRRTASSAAPPATAPSARGGTTPAPAAATGWCRTRRAR